MTKQRLMTDENKMDSVLFISHELKSSLNIITNSSSLLLDSYKGKIGKDAEKYITFIHNESQKIKKLIDNLLDFSRNESKPFPLNLKNENISNIINSCIEDLNDLIQEKNLIITSKIPKIFYFYVDKIKFEILIKNILRNAIKNTPLFGKINIEILKRKNNFDIIVSDNGIGFTEIEKEKIFRKFGRVDRPDTNSDNITESYGLGLYISEKIVKLHKGRIWVESKGRNNGSSFIMKFPIYFNS